MRRGAIPLLAAVLVALAVFPAPAVAAPPVGMADVRFRPASVAAAVGGLFTVEVVVEAAAEVEGAQVVTVYDPAYLEIVSAQPTGPLTYHLSSEHDAAAGRLFYAAGALGGRFPSGVFPLVRLTFRLKAAPAGPLAVSIPRESRHRTVIAAAGTNALHEAPVIDRDGGHNADREGGRNAVSSLPGGRRGADVRAVLHRARRSTAAGAISGRRRYLERSAIPALREGTPRGS